MNTLLKKLNFKNQKVITILNTPKTLQEQFNDFRFYTNIETSIPASDLEFIMVFVTKQSEINELVPQFIDKIQNDEILWMVYPKGTSKNYKCDFNRDNGWAILGQKGFEPVRMVAVDDDWSGLRFRKTSFIKTLTRDKNMALSDEAKARLS